MYVEQHYRGENWGDIVIAIIWVGMLKKEPDVCLFVSRTYSTVLSISPSHLLHSSSNPTFCLSVAGPPLVGSVTNLRMVPVELGRIRLLWTPVARATAYRLVIVNTQGKDLLHA